MISENELNTDLVQRKTYISPTLINGLSLMKFHLPQEQIVDIYQESLKEIHGEYQYYTGTASEVAYSFSSPSFKVLLYNDKYYSQVDKPLSIIRPFGYPIEKYDNTTNYLFLEFGEFDVSNSIDDFKISLKGYLRHRFHFATKNILHAPFPKRPEVYTPCKILAGTEYPMDINKKPVRIYEPYNSIIKTDQLLKPTFPFGDKQKKLFTDSLFEDVGNLKKTISKDPELRGLIHKKYQPMRWSFNAENLKNHQGFSEEAVIQAEIMGKRFCIQLTAGISNYAMKRDFCIDKRYMLSSKMVLEGYSVDDLRLVEDAFINDVNWLLYSAIFQNDLGNANYHGREAQLDGWLYRIPQDIYRRAFPLLEKMRVKDFVKFTQRSQELGQCSDDTDPLNLKRCIKNICENDFVLDVFLKQSFKNVKEKIIGETNCDYSDDDCVVQYLKQTMKLNMKDPEFLKTLDPSFMEKETGKRNQLDSRSITVEKFNYKPGFSNILSMNTELRLLMAGMFAFREEILYGLGKMIDKAYLTYLRRFPNHPGFTLKPEKQRPMETAVEKSVDDFDSRAMHALTDMQLRSMVESPIAICYDMLYHTKEYVKKQNEEQIQKAKRLNEAPPSSSFKNTCKNICIGTFRSVAFIGWKYCAGPIIVGTRDVFRKVKQGYREGGVLSSMDMGLEAIAENFIPGGGALLTMQKELHLEYEKQKNEPHKKSEENAALKPKRRKQKAAKLADESLRMPEELKLLADKIQQIKKEREDLQKLLKVKQALKNRRDNVRQSLIVDRSEVEKKQKEEEIQRALEGREKELAKERLMNEKRMERAKKQEEISQKHLLSQKGLEPFDKIRTEIEVMARSIEAIDKNRLKLEDLFNKLVKNTMIEKIITCQNLLFQNSFSSRTQRTIEQMKFREQNLVLLPGRFVKGEFVPDPYSDPYKLKPGTLSNLFKRKKIILKSLLDFIKKFNNHKRSSQLWDDYEQIVQFCSSLSKIFLKCQEQNNELSKLFDTISKIQEGISTQFDLLSKEISEVNVAHEQKSKAEGEHSSKDLIPSKKTRSEQIVERRQSQLDFKRTKNEKRKIEFLDRLKSLQPSNESATVVEVVKSTKNNKQGSSEIKDRAESHSHREPQKLLEQKDHSENLTLAYSDLNGAYGDRIYFSYRTGDRILKINQEIKQYLDEMSEILKILGESEDNATTGISRVIEKLNLDLIKDNAKENPNHFLRFSGNIVNGIEKHAIKSEIFAFIYLISCIMEKIKNSPIRHFFPRETARQFRDAVYHNPEFLSNLADDLNLKKLIEQRNHMRNLAFELVSYMCARLSHLNMSQEQAALAIAKLNSLLLKNHEHRILKRGFISNKRNTCKRIMNECIEYLTLTGPERKSHYDAMETEIASVHTFPKPLLKLMSDYADERILTWYFGEQRAKIVLNNSLALNLGEFGSYFKEYSRRYYKDKDFPWFESEFSKYDPEMIVKLRHALVRANANAVKNAKERENANANANENANANAKPTPNGSPANGGTHASQARVTIVPQFANFRRDQSNGEDMSQFITYSDLKSQKPAKSEDRKDAFAKK